MSKKGTSASNVLPNSAAADNCNTHMNTPDQGVNGKPAVPVFGKAVNLGKSRPAFSTIFLVWPDNGTG